MNHKNPVEKILRDFFVYIVYLEKFCSTSFLL